MRRVRLRSRRFEPRRLPPSGSRSCGGPGAGRRRSACGREGRGDAVRAGARASAAARAAAAQPKEVFEARTVGPVEKTYTGHPISLDFKDGDLQDIFRLFADISGLNVVVNPGVGGKVTLKLVELPWDQALDLILKTNGLGKTIDGNVIRIARLSDLQKEESDLRKLKEEQALAGDTVVWRKPLSYAKAAEMEPTIRKVALSARGTITLDTRTNTMIITDLGPNIEKAKELIADLDRATPQVEIEARIVVTSRNFTRDLGIQWGFLNQQTPQFGNTTNLAFPHSIVLNGQGVPGGGLPANQAGVATRRRHRNRGPRLRGQPAGHRLQLGDRRLAGQHPGQLQPRRGAHGARTAGPRPPALDAEGHDAEQPGSRDQAGRPDPDPDRGQQHGHGSVQGRRADPEGDAADHRGQHGDPGHRRRRTTRPTSRTW